MSAESPGRVEAWSGGELIWTVLWGADTLRPLGYVCHSRHNVSCQCGRRATCTRVRHAQTPATSAAVHVASAVAKTPTTPTPEEAP